MKNAKYLKKKTFDMVAVTPKRANAQNLTCFIACITAAFLSVTLMIVACVLPAVVNTVTENICWISMGLEALSVALGLVAYWVKRNAL